jgi:hypothetical protein
MIHLFFVSNVNCSKFLIQQVIEHTDSVIRSNILIGFLALLFSIFILTRGINNSFLCISALIALLFSSIQEILNNCVANETYRSYFIWITTHKYLPILVLCFVTYFVLKVFDIVTYMLYLYLLFNLYDIVLILNENRIEIVIINTAFILMAFFAYLLIDPTKNIILACLFSLFGSFGALLSCQYLFKVDFGYLEIYKNFLNDAWDDNMIKSLGAQTLICIFGTMIQLSKMLGKKL